MKWSKKYVNRLEDKDFLVIKPGGRKDKTGRTKPRRLRKLPVRNRAGHVDVKYVRAALGRIGQPRTDLTLAERATAKAKAKALLAREHVLREVDAELLKPYLRGRKAA